MQVFIKLLRYIIMGLVQGVTEPLPISSSGHMIIFAEIANYDFSDLNFKILVNFGSLIAILFYYRSLIKELAVGFFAYLFKKDKSQKKNFYYVLFIVLATIPAGIAGILLGDFVDQKLSNLFSVSIALFFTGCLLMYIHVQSKKAEREEVALHDSLFMGISQVVGLIPGISRSGITTSFGAMNGLKVDKALRFSFMMYIPASVGAIIFMLRDIATSGAQDIFVLGYIGALIASVIGTYVAIKLFFKLVKKENLKYFGYYCLGLSTILLLLIAFRVL